MSHDTSLVMCRLSLLAVYDLEPRKLTGTVKYVGKVDREYVDNRVYVGVRLDDPGEPQCTLHHLVTCEAQSLHQLALICSWSNTMQCVNHAVLCLVCVSSAVGDSDGLFKGKRYFTCTPKHGKMVRINNVIAVLYPKMVTVLC